MTFQDIFKSSFLDNVTSVSVLDMVLTMALAFCLGMFIFLIYKKTYSGVMYSSSFGVTLVALTMITSLVILAVTSNVVLSFSNGFIVVEDFPTALHYDVYHNGDKTRVDLTEEILREYELSPEIFKSPLDISLAVEILDFEAAVAAGEPVRSGQEEFTNYQESLAVFRLIYEILAHMSVYRDV